MVVFRFVLRLNVESNGGRVLVSQQSKSFSMKAFVIGWKRYPNANDKVQLLVS